MGKRNPEMGHSSPTFFKVVLSEMGEFMGYWCVILMEMKTII